MPFTTLEAFSFALETYKANIYRTCNLGGFWIIESKEGFFEMFNQNHEFGVPSRISI